MATVSASVREPLEWTDDNNAYRDIAHYQVYARSDGKWNVAVLSMRTDEPGGHEEKLGDYEMTTLQHARELGQSLADQRQVVIGTLASDNPVAGEPPPPRL
jgi:hypothetical protein